MTMEIDSFYAVHVFYGITNCFMHYKKGGGFVDTLDVLEAERFSSKEEAVKFINNDEDAREYVSSRNGAFVYVSKVSLSAKVSTCVKIA